LGNARKKKRTYRRRCETTGKESFGDHCVFCGSQDITVHHVVFQRFAPELINDKDNQIPMCSKCQKIYHFYTDILLDYLKLNSGQVRLHEIREKPLTIITPTPPPKETTKPTVTITGGQVTINF